MTRAEVFKLHTGDEVFWYDPDDGACSRVITIQTVEVLGGNPDPIVVLTEQGGAVVECFASELR